MMQASNDSTNLAPAALFAVGLAGLAAAAGTLFGLAGLLMWGIKLFDAIVPGTGDAPILAQSLAPYLTVLNFALTLVITVCGMLNLSMAMRWHDFLGGEWKRYLLLSALSLVAGALFLWVPNAS